MGIDRDLSPRELLQDWVESVTPLETDDEAQPIQGRAPLRSSGAGGGKPDGLDASHATPLRLCIRELASHRNLPEAEHAAAGHPPGPSTTVRLTS